MNSIFANIAGFNIKINFEINQSSDWQIEYLRNKIHSEILVFLKDFAVFSNFKKSDIEIVFKDGSRENTITTKLNKKTYIPIFKVKNSKTMTTYYQISLYQFQTVLKQALVILLRKNPGFFIHASSVMTKSGAYIFLGESGAGKSTIAELLNEKYPALIDDMGIIRRIKSKYYLCQTPFIEKGWWIKKTTKMNLIRKVLFLNKSKIFKISPIKNVELVTEKVLTQVEASNTSDIKLLKEALLFSKETFFSSIFFDREKEKLYKLIESSEEI